MGAFHALVMHGIPERFPQLRIGAIEVTAQWLPYVLHDMRLRYKKQGRRLDDDLMRTHRLFVACQTDDDLPYVLGYGTEDNLMIGSDYGHADTASELLALKGIRDKGEIAPGDQSTRSLPTTPPGSTGWRKTSGIPTMASFDFTRPSTGSGLATLRTNGLEGCPVRPELVEGLRTNVSFAPFVLSVAERQRSEVEGRHRTNRTGGGEHAGYRR